MPDKHKRPSVFSDPKPTPNSLFGEILDWMLAPLLLVWPISIAATHHVADEIANQAYDHVLAEQVVRIVRELKFGPDGEPVVKLPPSAVVSETTLWEGETDRQFFQVALDGGDPIAGAAELPGLLPGDERTPGVVLFRNGNLMGETVRIAYQLVPSPADARPLLIQAAETRRQRKALSSRIISGVLLPQFAIIPVAVVLVWLGLTRGLTPLARLAERIRTRRHNDLTPIDLATVPEELRSMVAAFNHMMARLEDNLEAQQRFIAAAAHQLKTPLTGLKTQTELALRETDCVQLNEYLQRIATGVDRAAHLTQQLLRLARAEASHETAQAKEAVDLAALTREVTARCVPRALARNIDLGFEIEGEREGAGKIMGISLLLCEMLDNLIDNAIKYTPPGGRVTVRLMLASAPIIEVEDTGIGIPKQDRARIFERFYRVLGTDAEGSGLGLAIVREIADLHQVRIEVRDNPHGQGSQFRLIFSHADGMAWAAPPSILIAPHNNKPDFVSFLSAYSTTMRLPHRVSRPAAFVELTTISGGRRGRLEFQSTEETHPCS
ncbi:MAG: sensor histidine kinase N-terminal domain-containing protein [Rhodocyclaceae bacterium]|nr:sensor histidine kinase N-terminal domain-containing protein [Rhodocyclaceae bacterium]